MRKLFLVSVLLLVSILFGADAFASTYKNGDFIRSSNGKIFLIKEQKKLYISSVAELKSYGKIRLFNVSNDVINSYSDFLVEANRKFFKAPDNKIFLIENNKKRHIKSIDELKSFGRTLIVNASYDRINSYPDAQTREFIVCPSGFHYDSGYCASDKMSCTNIYGSGFRNWVNGNWSSCQMTSCASGYRLSNYYCHFQSCAQGDHWENNGCVNNKRSCSIYNGAGYQYWNGSEWGLCTLSSCNAGYRSENNYCVLSANNTSPASTLTLVPDYQLIGLSPKETYLKILPGFYQVKTSEDMLLYYRTYGSQALLLVLEEQQQEFGTEGKQFIEMMLAIALAMFPPFETIKNSNASELVSGTEATLEYTIDESTSLYVSLSLENGIWKLNSQQLDSSMEY